MPDEPVSIAFTKDEALVLFAFLSRFSDTDTLDLEDQAEARALWNLCCLLERTLVEPFLPDCDARIQAARDRLRDTEA